MQSIPQKMAAKKPDSLPTRLSALLRDLARVPEPDGESGWARALHPGAVIGRFELVREVGRGGFGLVYEARDLDLGRPVAFKAVLPGKDLQVREQRLLREAEAAARLSHPNVVTLYDVGRSPQGPYLVLELLRGHTLARRMDQGPLSVPEALRIAIEVAKAIAHAHANGVVHRDLTPGNVFLCDDGQVKVLDLGMAYAFGRHRMDGGTPGYMAPEQRRGAPEDERSDVFALGVILYRMLANELPFPDDAAGPTRPAPALNVEDAPELGEVLSRMLELDPVNRPRDATAVLDPLVDALRRLEQTPSSGKLAAASKRRGRLIPLWALVLTGILAGVATGWAATHAVRTAAPLPPAPSIAVLPFENLSGPEEQQEHFSEGLAEEILNALARVDGLRVPGRTSSFFFKGKSARLADIGRELNVSSVLEGTVRVAGNRVRVTARVVNVADGYRRWTQTYDRELTDIFSVQEEIARSVVDALQVKFLEEAVSPIRSHATENPQVYAQYLIGRQQYHRLSREGFRRAVEAYEKALALDPGYAPAWAALGIPLYYLAEEAPTPKAYAEQTLRALAAAEKAVSLSPDLPDALSTRGILRAVVQYDWPGAKADLERAIAINGNDPDSRRRYAVLLQELGKLPEAIAQARKATDLDPLGQSWLSLGVLYQASGELDKAEAAYRRFLQFAPDSPPALQGLGRNLLLQSKPKEALAVFQRLPEEDFRLWGTAASEHALGNARASKEALEALTAKYAHTSALPIAEVFALRGEKDAAFAWLDRAIATPGGVEALYRTNPFFRSLRDDPRYTALLRKMKLPAD